MIAVSILNSLVLVLRHYSVSEHPTIQLRFNALFTASRCTNGGGTLAPKLFMPLTLIVKFFQVFALYFASPPLVLHKYIIVIVLSSFVSIALLI